MDVTVKLSRQTNRAVVVRPRKVSCPWKRSKNELSATSVSYEVGSKGLQARKVSEPCQNTSKIEGLTGKVVLLGECPIKLLDEADIVVTNPPFSLFREFLDLLMVRGKQILVIGNMNAIKYKAVFPHIQSNRLWLGPSISSGDREFQVPQSYPLNAAGTRVDEDGNKYIRVKGVRWFTNLDHGRRHEPLNLMSRADNLKFNKKLEGKQAYEKYDNYDAIEVPYTAAIPADYDGIMGVPISFLDKYSPEQFEIIWQASGNTRASTPPEILSRMGYSQHKDDRGGCSILGGKRTYDRIFIKARR